MRSTPDQPTYTAFAGHRRLASGAAREVASAAAGALARGESHVLVFDDKTGEQVELGPPAREPEIVPRSPPAPKPGRGRPKLGVVAREVTLLPRHWEWLAAQPGGASAALRRLVEDASRSSPAEARQARDAGYKVMSVLAGDLPGYEEATRALFAGNAEAFNTIVADWPIDVRTYVLRFVDPQPSGGSPSA